MSTSYLVKKMQEIAEKNSLKVNIKAIAEPHVDEESKSADIVLLGPQISFLRDAIVKRIGEKTPVVAINSEDFGRINAGKILKDTLIAIRESKGR
jgi:PTS system cellobiose-specific IIB component